MRNKIFFIAVVALILAVFVYAPIHNILMSAGIVPYENVGNIIKVDKVYGEDELMADFFNGIEEGKRDIVDTYTNHIPFYLELTSFVKDFKQTLNAPIKKTFQKIGDDIVRDRLYESLGIKK